MKKLSLLLLAWCCSSLTVADVASLNSQLKRQYPNLNFQNIAATEVHGIYSATLDKQIVYLDEAGQHVMLGSMIRLKDQKNLTQNLVIQNNHVDWHNLPFQDALKQVKGNGQHQLAIFVDPNCPYCKKLEKELDKLNNVTIYRFLYPIRPQSIVPSKQVWCSPNRNYAWDNLMGRGLMPTASSTCANPIQRNLQLGQKLKIEGTPGLIFANGYRALGYTSAEQIQAFWQQNGL